MSTRRVSPLLGANHRAKVTKGAVAVRNVIAHNVAVPGPAATREVVDFITTRAGRISGRGRAAGQALRHRRARRHARRVDDRGQRDSARLHARAATSTRRGDGVRRRSRSAPARRRRRS